MKTIRILFKKAEGLNGISSYTALAEIVTLHFDRLKFNYCHSEIWFPLINKAGRCFFGDKYAFEGQCFSARPDGVCFKPAYEVLQGFGWDYWEIEITDKQYETIYQFAQKENGDKYDYDGLFSFVLFIIVSQDPSKWYCTEWVGTACDIISIVDVAKYRKKDYIKITPRDLAAAFYKKYGSPKAIEVKQ